MKQAQQEAAIKLLEDILEWDGITDDLPLPLYERVVDLLDDIQGTE